MKKIILTALLCGATAFALACSGDDNGNGDGGNDSGPADTGGGDVNKTDGGSDSGNNPAPPTLKTQVDRMGRPAINTALNHAFDSTSAAGTAKDAYNADKNVSGWAAAYTPEFEHNLAILDGLDQTCGNQVGYSNGSYAALAGLTADDRLYIDTSVATCTTYLGVELKALGITQTADCGGRKLSYDVIDETYSAVAAGTLSGVTDNVGPVAAKTNGTTFPYLAAPQ
ncbi:MAG TPA: hypothetical protein VGH28_20695 [Polyangiaceae bacterium]|jgi:hypothetical protein